MFRVGQKVVCVNSDHCGLSGTRFDLTMMPVRGEVYTVSAVGLTHRLDPSGLPCIQVREINRSEPIWAHRFRPIVERKTDISVFREILRKATKKVGESARAVEQAKGGEA